MYAKNLAKAAVGMMVITLFSQILGFGREIVIAAQLGATSAGDAFKMAVFIPVMLFGVVNYALAHTFIPLLTEQEARSGQTAVNRYTANITNIITALLFSLSVLALLINPWIVRWMAPGFDQPTYQLTVQLTYLIMPVILLLGLIGLTTGYLHFRQVFTLPQIGGIVFNILIIGSLIVLVPKLGVKGAIIAMITGYSGQVLFLFSIAWHHGYRFRLVFDWQDPYLLRMLKLASPMVVGTAVGMLAKIVDRIFASTLSEGCISALDYAVLLNEFAFTVFVINIGSVYFPTLSQAGCLSNWRNYRDHLLRGANFIIYLILPVSAGLMTLCEPIVSLVFQRGAFDFRATAMTSTVLFYYNIGLLGTSLQYFLSQGFYAIQDTVTPIINGIFMVLLKILLTFILVKVMGLGGITLATSLASSLMVFYLAYRLKNKIPELDYRTIKIAIIKGGLAAFLMAAAVMEIDLILTRPDAGRTGLLIRLLLDVGLGALVYCLILQVLRVKELQELLDLAGEKINLTGWKKYLRRRQLMDDQEIAKKKSKLGIPAFAQNNANAYNVLEETTAGPVPNPGGRRREPEDHQIPPSLSDGLTVSFTGEYTPKEIAAILYSISDLLKSTDQRYFINLQVREITPEKESQTP